MEARPRSAEPRAVTSPPEKRAGGISLFIRIFGPYLVGGLLVWAACVAVAYLALDENVGLAVIFGSMFPFVGYYAWLAVGWWRGKPLPKDADKRRWTTAPTWLSQPSQNDGDQVRRAACAEAIFGILLVLGPFALFALYGRGDDVVVAAVVVGVFAVSALLWISVVAWGRPRWLLPGEYRRPDLYLRSHSVVNPRTGKSKKRTRPKARQNR